MQEEFLWLLKNTIVTFLFLEVMDSFGLLSFRLSGEAPQMRGKRGYYCRLGWVVMLLGGAERRLYQR
jgi:hypothetical protein